MIYILTLFLSPVRVLKSLFLTRQFVPVHVALYDSEEICPESSRRTRLTLMN